MKEIEMKRTLQPNCPCRIGPIISHWFLSNIIAFINNIIAHYVRVSHRHDHQPTRPYRRWPRPSVIAWRIITYRPTKENIHLRPHSTLSIYIPVNKKWWPIRNRPSKPKTNATLASHRRHRQSVFRKHCPTVFFGFLFCWKGKVEIDHSLTCGDEEAERGMGTTEPHFNVK